MTFAICHCQFALFLVAVLASPAFGQGKTKETPSSRGSRLSYDQAAAQLGLEPKLVNQAVAELEQKGLGSKNAITFLVVARERALRLIKGGTITKEEIDENVKETIDGLYKAYQEKGENWKDAIEEYGLLIPDVLRQATTIIKAARITETKARKAAGGSAQSEYPANLSQTLTQRLNVREEILKEAWREVKVVPLRSALMLLLLAKERTDRFVALRSAAEGDREKAFLENVKFFLGQLQRGTGWGDLGIQVGRHANDLIREADGIISPKKPSKAKPEAEEAPR